MKINIRNQGLTTFQGIYFPDNITELDCSNNHLTSLQYCPERLQVLICGDNYLTSLQYCPTSLQKLCCHNNLINPPSVYADTFIHLD